MCEKYMLILVMVVGLIVGCSPTEENTQTAAEQIINEAIEKTCGGNCEQATIEFDFRNIKYKSTRNGGQYSLERSYTDSLTKVKDVLTNNGFKRFLNDEVVAVHDSLALRYSNSVNSVHYFAALPYGLNTPAVNKKLVGTDTINGKTYYEIEVTFSEEGGGEDFEDEFMFWINTQNHTVDYLAYSYATNGGGIRFREAYNPRVIEGIRFVDYNNYKPETLGIPLSELDDLFEEGKLKLLSKIETENVSVQLTKNIK